MSAHRNRACVLLMLVVALVTACNFPGMSAIQPSPDALYTVAAQTLIAQLTQTALSAAPTEQAAPIGQAAATQATAAAPTETQAAVPSPQASATETQAPENTRTPGPTETLTQTPAPSVPVAIAEMNTFCRLGPSKAYKDVGLLVEGQRSEVHGRDSAHQWWYIRNPAKPGQFCWVWTDTIQVEGDTAGLPVITPPPSPPTATNTALPGFKASYSNVHDCGDTPTAVLQIVNTSGVDLDSLELKIVDLTSGITLFGPDDSDAPFMGSSGECPPGGDVLSAGKTGYIGGPIGDAPSGDKARATILLCSENDLDGLCIEKRVDFTLP